MSIGRAVYITGIRVTASNLVGECTDYQIIFCARHAKVVSDQVPFGAADLELLTDYDLMMLYNWVSK
jgi:hypothetical protein